MPQSKEQKKNCYQQWYDSVSVLSAAVVVTPEFNIEFVKRLTDNISLDACEMAPMIIDLQWIDNVRPERVVIASGSCTTLMSLKYYNFRRGFTIQNITIIIRYSPNAKDG